jgi:hypothetical protein
VILVADLDRIAQARLADAGALAAAGRFDGAVYLCGYAVEIALKARICRTLAWSAFPESNSEFQSLQSFRTHELAVLLRLSGRQADIKTGHFAAWSIVEVWRPESRYKAIGSYSGTDAATMINSSAELVGAL